jgi:hypothetical protein
MLITEQKTIDILAWVEKAKTDPVKYRQRQITEILLAAIILSKNLHGNVYLKGGVLMNLAYESPRSTGDVDFTTTVNPEQYSEIFKDELDISLARAASRLGYTDINCRVQTIRPQPRQFPDAKAPALRITIGSAIRNTPEEQRLIAGHAPAVLHVDISFSEPVERTEIILWNNPGGIAAYSLVEIIAEKLRALLQQKTRNRFRRQDIYDVAHLLEKFPLDDVEGAEVLRIMKIKSEARDITPEMESLSDPEIADRARKNWDTMQEELEEPLPDFDERFSIVERFYRGLPW